MPNIVNKDQNLIFQQTDKNTDDKNVDLSQPMEAAEFVSIMDDEPIEEKEEGTVKIRVYKTYMRTIGLWLAGLVLLSLIGL